MEMFKAKFLKLIAAMISGKWVIGISCRMSVSGPFYKKMEKIFLASIKKIVSRDFKVCVLVPLGYILCRILDYSGLGAGSLP
jgi:hypothetical protein